MTFDITAEEVRTLEFCFYRPININGPITLARFSDSRRGDSGRYGRFWLYGDYMRELLAADHTGFHRFWNTWV